MYLCHFIVRWTKCCLSKVNKLFLSLESRLRKEVDLRNILSLYLYLHIKCLNQSKHTILFENFIYIVFISRFREDLSSVAVLWTVPLHVLNEATRINSTKKVAVIMFLTTVSGKENRNLRVLLWKVCCSLCKPYKLQGISWCGLRQYCICAGELLVHHII